ncbi:MAG: YwqG family protein [Aggregatilineales bacterium]
MINREKLLELIHEHGLAQYADAILNASKPAIHISRKRVADDSEIPVGVSKLGGSPDMPADFVWPQWNGTPLTFIGQFRMAEVAPFDIEHVLPPTGLLSFFFEADQRISYQHPDKRGSWKVIYLENETAPLERIPHPRVSDILSQLAPCAVTFSQMLTLPVRDLNDYDETGDTFYAHGRGLEKLKILNVDTHRYGDLSRAAYERRLLHQLLGNPDQIQGDIRYESQLEANGVALGSIIPNDPRIFQAAQDANNWRLLLQIDSDSDDDGLGIMWDDVGCVYYCIQNDALDKRDFEHCAVTMQGN